MLRKLSSDDVFSLFDYFSSKMSRFRDTSANRTSREEAMVVKFLKLIVDKYGSSTSHRFLFKYFSYQFYYWSDKDTRFGRGIVMLGWVIGAKAHTRWHDSKEDHWYSYSSTLLKENGVSLNEWLKSIGLDEKPKMTLLLEHEEDDRGRMHNTGEGLLLCSDYTTMWHPSSKWCLSCDNIEMCMAIMEVRYPKVYEARKAISGKKGVSSKERVDG